MTKFLYMPVVLGLVFGCAGFAAGNNNDENPVERHQRVGLEVVAIGNQMSAKEQELRVLAAQHDNMFEHVEELKNLKRSQPNRLEEINNIIILLQESGLQHIIDKLEEYMVINRQWKRTVAELEEAQEALPRV